MRRTPTDAHDPTVASASQPDPGRDQRDDEPDGPAARQHEETLYDHVGGHAGLHRLVAAWYPTVLADPLLQPLFGAGHADHVPHLTAFLGEVFGGPPLYTEELGGFPSMLAPHRGKRIREDQRQRFVELFLAAADATGVPDDARTRDALRGYLEFGTRVAVQNSHATADDELDDCQEVPRWDW